MARVAIRPLSLAMCGLNTCRSYRPKQDECALSSAALHVPDKNGNDFVQTVADEERHSKAMESDAPCS